MNIALLTDFGTQDYFVGAMKGVILSINNEAQIIDITHEIAAQSIQSASFTLRACYKDFPKQTIFVAVVDPGVGSARRAILVETPNYFFIAPDNGLLSFVYDEAEKFRVFELTNKNFLAEKISTTFHGRDIFAPVAAHLSKGVQPSEFGREIADFIRFDETKPQKISENIIQAEIIHADRFGNLITNLKSADLSENFVIKINDCEIKNHRKFFAEAEKDEIFSIVGSADRLEIVEFCGSAEQKLNAKIGDVVYLNFI